MILRKMKSIALLSVAALLITYQTPPAEAVRI